MSILGIGVDIVHVPRIAALLNRRGPTRLATRILNLEEFSRWESLPLSDNPGQARFLSVQ
jgi:holo-[acyl-carrier protein] synthase